MSTVVRTLPTPLSLSDFDVGVTLGTGSFGRVRFSTHRVSYIVSIIYCFNKYNSIMILITILYIGYWFLLGSKNVKESGSYKITTGMFNLTLIPLYCK